MELAKQESYWLHYPSFRRASLRSPAEKMGGAAKAGWYSAPPLKVSVHAGAVWAGAGDVLDWRVGEVRRLCARQPPGPASSLPASSCATSWLVVRGRRVSTSWR